MTEPLRRLVAAPSAFPLPYASHHLTMRSHTREKVRPMVAVVFPQNPHLTNKDRQKQCTVVKMMKLDQSGGRTIWEE